MENEALGESEEDIDFTEHIICESDILISKDSDISNDEKSENETRYELLEDGENSTIQFVSVPVLQEQEIKTTWTQQMTKALIEEYTGLLAEFRDPDKKQKDVWIHLSNKLQERGFSVTWQMCDRKFRNLKQTFRTIYYSNRSERNKRRWEYYEDLSNLVNPYAYRHKSSSPILNDKVENIENGPLLKTPNIEPVNAASILQTLTQSEQFSYQTPESYLAECENEIPPWFKNFLAQFKNEQERVLQNIGKMHQETKEIELKKIALLENIAALLKSQKQ